MSRHSDGRVFVGNLPSEVTSHDIKDLFEEFGHIRNVELKNSNRGTPFAFVEFEDTADARYAVRKRHGYKYEGLYLRVEHPHANSGGRERDYDSSRGRSRSRDSYRSSSRHESDYKSRYTKGYRSRYSTAPRRSDYRIVVTGLPRSGSWQDLKDHMRKAGDVVYADIVRNGEGIVEFARYDDMKYAVEKLDGSRFESHQGEQSTVTVKECRKRRRSRSRSRSRSRRSSSRSVSKHSRSRSASRSVSARSDDDDKRKNGSRSVSESKSPTPKRRKRSSSRSASGSPRTSPIDRRSSDPSPNRHDSR